MWQDEWKEISEKGITYCSQLGKHGYLQSLHDTGLFDSKVLDIGSGVKSPITGLKPSLECIVSVDWAIDKICTDTRCGLNIDVHDLLNDDQWKKFCVTTAQFLHQENHPEFDSVFCLNILNYIKYADVIPRLVALLRPNGRLFIGHQKNLGFSELFYDRQAKSPRNQEICACVQKVARITHLIFPFPELIESDELYLQPRKKHESIHFETEYMFLVAKKSSSISDGLPLPRPIRKFGTEQQLQFEEFYK